MATKMHDGWNWQAFFWIVFVIVTIGGFTFRDILDARQQTHRIDACIAAHKTAIVENDKLKECR
jgi:hypothetical protein